MNANSYISKSMYVRGLKCLKSLYLYKYNPELREVDKSTQAKFDTGHKVGVLAQQLFPGGVDCGFEVTNDAQKSLRLTSEAIKAGKKVIYEAAFQYNGMLAIADIMVKVRDKWNVFEVKSSTEIHDYQLNDVSLQYYVINGAEISIKDFSITYINNQYVKNGDINIFELFTTESVLKDILSMQNEIEPNFKIFQSALNTKKTLDIDIGPHCFEPFDCDFCNHCWKHIPEYSVFNLSRIGNKAYTLYNNGVVKIKDLPKSYSLSTSQQIEVDCHVQNKPYINKAEISNFLKQLEYPLYFLDFETIQSAIPIWDNSKPYQLIPFQYSLHYKETKDSKPEHFEFLGEGNNDPRVPLIEKLLKDTKSKGTILVYNMTFEKTRLLEIARDFPQYNSKIEKLISRMIDLLVPFRSRHYYEPQMRSSASLKSVLPAINPKFSYSNLEIQEGGTASLEYLRMLYSKDEKEIQQIRKNLLEYCKQDTFALIVLLNELENIL